MKPVATLLLIAATALALALPATADAKGKKTHKSYDKHLAQSGKPFKHRATPDHGPVRHLAAGCPPGLAKKNPPCVPPGQAKKYHNHDHDHDHDHDHYRIGDRVGDDYILIPDPARYGFDPAYLYYRLGGDVFRVDRDTREVINFIGAAAALLD